MMDTFIQVYNVFFFYQVTYFTTEFKLFDQMIDHGSPSVGSRPCLQVLWQKSNSVGVLFISHQSIPSGATPKYMTRPRVLGGTRGDQRGTREGPGREFYGKGERKESGRENKGRGGSSPIPVRRYKSDQNGYPLERIFLLNFAIAKYVCLHCFKKI